MYLMEKDLTPNQVYSKTVTWDQRAGTPLARVPNGTYSLTARFDGAVHSSSSSFRLTPVTSPKAINASRGPNARQ